MNDLPLFKNLDIQETAGTITRLVDGLADENYQSVVDSVVVILKDNPDAVDWFMNQDFDFPFSMEVYSKLK